MIARKPRIMRIIQTPQRWTIFSAILCAFCEPIIADKLVYTACQAPTPNPLTGCPPNTIWVSKTASGANFTTIQGAISSLPDNNTNYTILVMPGIYVEQLNVTRPAPLTILGQTSTPNAQENNTVTVYWAAANANGKFTDNAFTSVLTVAPTLEASLTGSGPTGYPVPANTPFGCIDFRVYNIDFRNVATEFSAGPSLAVSVSRANAGFYFSGFYSYQDTVYVGKLGNAYFYRNTIAGQTDFLYGFGTAWIQHSQIQLRSCGGGIVAWKGTNTTFPNKYGIYISGSTLTAANISIAPSIVGKCYLGRPWNAQHRSVYLSTYMDASIRPQGYEKWSTNPLTWNYNNWTVMAEFNSSGPGFDLAARIKGNLTVEFTAAQARTYRSPLDVFMTPNGAQPDVSWIDPAAYTW